MADVIEINDLDELQSYRLAWNELHAKTPRASFFHTFDWFEIYWKHFGADQKMRVLIVRAAGTPIGIVPLCVRREHYHVGNVRVLNYPLSDWATWYGPIGGNSSATMFMAMRHLRETPRDWDMIDLRWTDAEQTDRGTTGRALRAAGLQPNKSAYQQCSLIRMDSGDWKSYFSNLPKKWRDEIRRQKRGAERLGEVVVERHRPLSAANGDGDPRWDLFEDCMEISRRSWQGSSTTGTTLSHEGVSDFLRDCHAAAAKLGMLDVAVLKIDGKPAAFQYNYHFEGNLYGLRMGFDPQFSRLGVGKVLMANVIEDSFARGDKVLDLGIGDFRFKRQFRNAVETSHRFTCYPLRAIRSQGVRLTRWVKSRLATEVAPVSSKAKS